MSRNKDVLTTIEKMSLSPVTIESLLVRYWLTTSIGANLGTINPIVLKPYIKKSKYTSIHFTYLF